MILAILSLELWLSCGFHSTFSFSPRYSFFNLIQRSFSNPTMYLNITYSQTFFWSFDPHPLVHEEIPRWIIAEQYRNWWTVRAWSVPIQPDAMNNKDTESIHSIYNQVSPYITRRLLESFTMSQQCYIWGERKRKKTPQQIMHCLFRHLTLTITTVLWTQLL